MKCENCIHQEICEIRITYCQYSGLDLDHFSENCRHFIHECQLERMREKIKNQREQLRQFNEDRQRNIGKAYLEGQRDMKDYITMHLVSKLKDLLE